MTLQGFLDGYDLSGECFVDFHQISVFEIKSQCLLGLCDGMNGSESHAFRFASRVAVAHYPAQGLQPVLQASFLGGEEQGYGAIGHLRGVACSYRTFFFEYWPESAKRFLGLFFPRTNVCLDNLEMVLVVLGVGGLDFLCQVVLGSYRQTVRTESETILFLTGYLEFPSQQFCGLAHVHVTGGIVQAKPQGHVRPKIRGTKPSQSAKFVKRSLGFGELGEFVGGSSMKEKWHVAHAFGATHQEYLSASRIRQVNCMGDRFHS